MAKPTNPVQGVSSKEIAQALIRGRCLSPDRRREKLPHFQPPQKTVNKGAAYKSNDSAGVKASFSWRRRGPNEKVYREETSYQAFTKNTEIR